MFSRIRWTSHERRNDRWGVRFHKPETSSNNNRRYSKSFTVIPKSAKLKKPAQKIFNRRWILPQISGVLSLRRVLWIERYLHHHKREIIFVVTIVWALDCFCVRYGTRDDLCMILPLVHSLTAVSSHQHLWSVFHACDRHACFVVPHVCVSLRKLLIYFHWVATKSKGQGRISQFTFSSLVV